jgi:uncharacterized protein YkwD
MSTGARPADSQAMRVRIMLAAALAALCAVGAASATSSEPAARLSAGMTRAPRLETAVLAQLNGVRREHGLVPLKPSAKLEQAADEHSRQMASVGYFEHASADGSAFWKRVARFYPSAGRSLWAVGENLLWSSPDVDAAGALRLWMASPEHRANILTARWREIGVSAIRAAAAPGAYKGLDVTIVTTDFGVRR